MLKIVADIIVVAGHEAAAEAEMRALIAPTRAEPGCVEYELFRDAENPARFVFVETWDSEPLWRAHMAAPHLVRDVEVTRPMFASFTVTMLDRVA